MNNVNFTRKQMKRMEYCFTHPLFHEKKKHGPQSATNAGNASTCKKCVRLVLKSLSVGITND